MKLNYIKQQGYGLLSAVIRQILAFPGGGAIKAKGAEHCHFHSEGGGNI